FDDMLAVVEYEEESSRMERFRECLEERAAGLFPNVESGPEGLGNEAWIRDRGQLHEHDAVPVLSLGDLGEPECQACLAAASGSGERQQAPAGKAPLPFDDLALTSDEPGLRRRGHELE